MMRKRINEIIEKANGGDSSSKRYDYFMIVTIISSIIPLCFTTQNAVLTALDKASAAIFIIDYILRFATADYSSGKKGIVPFLLYPLRPMAIIDLLSILPSVTGMNYAFKVFRVLRLLKSLRVFKIFRYSKNIQIISNVLARKKDALLTVGILAMSYIFVTALVIFQVEPATFDSFFQALYWSTISLTTVGYGDIYPTSAIGQLISMVSSFLGIAVVALPSGIIISGYQDEIEKSEDE